MANETNIISKLTKGLKLKINKKKKSNWKSLHSNESLPPTPSEELMLYSGTEEELYQAKMNVQANRSFSYHTSHLSDNETNYNTNNILAGLNSTNNQTNISSMAIGRSKTTYNQPNTTSYSYQNGSVLRNNNFNLYQQTQTLQNNYLYPTSNNTNRKNSYQTVCVTSPSSSTSQSKPIPINYTSSSTNNIPYPSAPNSPLSFDSSDTYVNDNNPFKINTTINPKATTKQINTQLTITTTNIDPALSHSLISPIEFDGSGNEIKRSTTIATINMNQQETTTNSRTTKQNSNKEQISRSKSAKRIKPLITFDTPPVVTPITAPDSDFEDSIRGRKRSSKKSKKHVKKRSSNLLTLKTTDIKDSSLSKMNKKSYSGNNYSSGPSSAAIAAKVNKRLYSSNEEDDDVPLGIIQYKCLSSLLQESAPSNISSLQSNTKSFKSHSKNNYGYVSPPATDDPYCSSEKYDFPKFNNYYHENYVI
ncbi:hypothetical protein BCR32DRAFT_248223 [Anaeromyces robustus]|jgi:hypothetical protein|uniref:Uncharacterized protein n=1 Tax=Anaeromyces robustus TaxID=1754192 RepID=A0A1Y1WUV7_9FUNG|nr:hypothetical protein BCR32DRAFT_248223 [Anaeromyces robustus]|eukprot:ORX77078.1 hypothetical protein BCR32DRAFT_248223 [Anaeromyces robustus]